MNPNWNHIVREHLAALRLPPEREIEIVEELALCFEAVYEDALANGLSEAEAEARAVQGYDWRLLECELSRAEQLLATQALQSSLELIERKGGIRMESLLQDVRYGVRMSLKQPGFTLIAVITLALGIGANTGVFSLVNTVLLRPLPIAQPERVFEVTPLREGANIGATSYPVYKDFRDRNDVLEGLAAYRFLPMSLSRNGNNEIVLGYGVSGNYFDLLGVRAAQGRMFTQEDDRLPGAHPVAVISYGCWQRRFGGDPRVVGQNVTINNYSFTLIGVAPPEFQGTALMFAPEIYAPLNMAKQIEPGSRWLENRGNGALMLLGRLKPNVTTAQAKASMDGLAAQIRREQPEDDDIHFSLTPPGLIMPMLRNATLGFAGVLLGIVGLTLLIACTNLANLLLARATRRRKEIAVRLALGATRGRVMRQLLTESVLLAAAGGALGWLLAQWMVSLVAAFKPPVDIALTIDLKVDWRVLLFTMLISLVTGVLFGLAPAWQVTKPDLIPALKDEAGGGGFRRAWLRNALVVAQVALSLVMLAGAGLIVRSLQHVQTAGPGFDIEHTVTASVDLNLQGYDRARAKAFQKQMLARIETLPGVQSVSLAGALPLSLNFSSRGIYAEGQPFTRAADLPETMINEIWPRYFETMGIPLVAGRDFTMRDDNENARPVIINEAFARRFWPGQNAIGKRLSFGGPSQPFWDVVGVAKDSKYFSLGEDPQPYAYFPMLRDGEEDVAIVVRANSDPTSLIQAMRREIQRLDANLPVTEAKTIREHMRLSLFPLRAGAWVAGSFAVLSLLLAGLGIYGVMSYATAQRAREIGIRMALGAQAGDVLRLALRQGLALALIGLTLGLAGALAVTQLMKSVLYGVSATDAATFGGVTLLLALILLLACYVPAQRATRIDPLVALRHE